ncbi:MAG TPA: type IV pilin protein [Burkholderiaceae bacterium]|nr:type IV pilin protein [Burkholderiaceae bacterium]
MRRSSGFTLIELMVAVAVIGILAAIAYPSYQDQIRKSRRAEAQSTLMSIAGRQQQFLLDTRSYADSVATLNLNVPTSVSPHYTVTITVSAATSTLPAFTATAAPIGRQVSDKCATLTVTHSGAKAPTTCW